MRHRRHHHRASRGTHFFFRRSLLANLSASNLFATTASSGGQLLPPLALAHQPSRNCITPERCINAKKQNKIQSLDKTAFAGAGPATQRATGTQRVVHSRTGIALQGSGAFSNHSSAIPCVVCAIVVNIIGRRGALTGLGPISLLRSCSRPRLPRGSAPAPPGACSPALSQLLYS